MLDGVVPVLVERSQQLLETLLDPVGVGRVLVEGVGEAGHGHLLALKFGRNMSLGVPSRVGSTSATSVLCRTP